MIILVPLSKLLTSLSENIKSLTVHIRHLKTLSQMLKYLKCIFLKTFLKQSVLTVKMYIHSFAKKGNNGILK